MAPKLGTLIKFLRPEAVTVEDLNQANWAGVVNTATALEHLHTAWRASACAQTLALFFLWVLYGFL